MAYTLNLKMLSRSDLPAQTFSSVDDAVHSAVQIKVSCTAEERKELLMFVSDDEGVMLATNREIDNAYKDWLDSHVDAHLYLKAFFAGDSSLRRIHLATSEPLPRF